MLQSSAERYDLARRPVRFYAIDKCLFAVNVARMNVPGAVSDINASANGVSDIRYKCVQRSR